MKKWARIFLALILVATLSLGGVLPASAKQFQDVTRSGMGEEIFDSINYVSDNGILVGTTSTSFGPNTTLTRAMIVAVLYRWSGDGGSYSNPFTDVYKSDYYYNAVGWAWQNRIVFGTTETQFSPTKTVTTEQFFAFLYRYALKYHSDKTDYTDASITSHPDYGYVTEYAKPALRWAKQYHILQLTNSSYIWPQSGMARKNVALYITRYSLQVKGFDEEDRFSFANLTGDFSKKIIIDDIFYQKLMNDVDANEGSSAEQYKVSIRNTVWDKNNQLKDNDGTCYGMSTVQYLDKIGKIDFNRNTCGAKNMGSVVAPIKNRIVESVLNYYQLTQFPAYRSERKYLNTSLGVGPSSLYNEIQKNGPVIFNFTSESGYSHSVIALDCEDLGSGSYGRNYSLTLLDPNVSGLRDAVLNVNGNSVTLDWDTLQSLSFIPRAKVNFWDNYDFDYIYNSRSYARAASQTSDITVEGMSEDTVVLYLSAIPIKIQNAEGAVLEYDGTTFTGNIEILEQQYITGGNRFNLTVPYSDSFTYTVSNGEAFFGVFAKTYYGCASGVGITKVQLNNLREIQLEGSCIETHVDGRLAQESFEYLAISGELNGSAAIQYTEDGAIITGLSGTGELSAAHINPVYQTITTPYTFESKLVAVQSISNDKNQPFRVEEDLYNEKT